MTADEAAEIFEREVQHWRHESHASLQAHLNSPVVYEIVGNSGIRYQFEVEVVWEGSSDEGNLRVFVTTDDGQGWRLTNRRMRHDDFIKAPEGDFVGE